MNATEIQKLIDLANTHPYLVALGAIWVMAWKGLALWRAAERQSLPWFVVLLVLNTLGLLEIIYIFFVAKPKKSETSSEPTVS